jgi:adenosylhomocysteine nucleosidase
MTHHFQPQDLSLQNALFVFALASEASTEFDHCHKLITGIGKVSAAYELTKKIAKSRPSMIINLGSAGSNFFSKGAIVCCNRFIQRDMDVRGLGFQLYETPLSNLPPVLEYGMLFKDLPRGICGTGDSFEMHHLSSDYNVIDMEAHTLALIAMKEQIPFLCLKYISDGSNGSAADDWTVQVHHAAAAFSKLLF